MAQNYDLTQTGPELQARVDQVFPNRDAIEQETATRESQDESLETSLKAYTDTEQARAEAVEGALDTRVSANEVDIDLLKSQYEALTQSDIIVGPLPSTGQPNKIYRVPGSTYYTDYMWANGGWVKLAEYSTLDGYVYKGIATPTGTPVQSAEAVFYFAVQPGTYTNYGGLVVTNTIAMLKYNGTEWTKDDLIGIDDKPTAGSDNLVKSGAVAASVVYDISAANAVDGQLATYADLTAALNGGDNVPVDIRKGGMEIKFVQSSDNYYVQFRCIADEFTTDVTKWAICDDEVLVNDPIYIDAKIDSDGNLLEGTKKDNTKQFTGDLQVDGHVINAELQNSIDDKVTSEEGKSLIDSGVAQSNFTTDNPQWLDVVLDNDNNIVEGILRRGEKVQNLPVETPFSEESYEENPEYIEADIAPNGTILESLSKDGKKYVAGISEKLESIDKTVQYYHRIYPHNAIVSFIDDDCGVNTPEIWGRIINATGIRMGFACVTGIMGHEPGVEIPSVLTPMSLENLQALYDAGHEVYSHSWSHPSFKEASLNTINEECRKSRDWLNEHGFTRNSDVIVYPGGMGTSDTDKFDVVRRNYMYGVDTYGNYDYYGYGSGVNPEPFINDLAIARCNGDTLSLSELKYRFDIAVRDKKLLVVMNHSYELNADKENQIAKLISFIEYIQNTSAVILPLQDAIHQIYGWH